MHGSTAPRSESMVNFRKVSIELKIFMGAVAKKLIFNLRLLHLSARYTQINIYEFEAKI